MDESNLYPHTLDLPKTPQEYEAYLNTVTDNNGIFRGDEKKPLKSQYLPSEKYFLPKGMYSIETVQEPYTSLVGLHHRVIFDLDLISQMAVYNTYRKRGSYNIELIYENRWLHADTLLILWDQGMPIGLLIISKYSLTLPLNGLNLTDEAKEIFNAKSLETISFQLYFIQGLMVSYPHKGLGGQLILNYFIPELILHQESCLPKVLDIDTMQIGIHRGGIYILTHTDKLPPFHFSNTHLIPVTQGIIRDMTILHGFHQITPVSFRESAGFDLVTGTDQGAMNPNVSYDLDEQGQAILPANELALSSYKSFRQLLGNNIGKRGVFSLGIWDQKLVTKHLRLQQRYSTRLGE